MLTCSAARLESWNLSDILCNTKNMVIGFVGLESCTKYTAFLQLFGRLDEEVPFEIKATIIIIIIIIIANVLADSAFHVRWDTLYKGVIDLY